MENKRIIKKSALYFIGNFSAKILSSLLVPIYAFYISAEDLGIYDYSQTIMNILIPIVFISIWEAIIRFILGQEGNGEKEKKYATSAMFTISMCILVIIGVYIVNNVVAVQYSTYFTIMTCFSALAQIWQYYSRASERNKLYVVTSIISTAVNLLLNILLIIVFKMNIEALYISYIVAQMTTFFILEFRLKIIKLIKPKNIDIKLLKEMLIYSAPLVVNSIAAWLFTGFGKIIIFENLGASSNGMYTFASKFVTIITTVGNIITMALLEEAMISLKNGTLDNYPIVLENVFRIFLSIIMIAMPAITIFYGCIDTTEYYESLKIVPILLLYAVFLTMATNFSIIFKTINKNKYQVITTILGSVIMLTISYFLLNAFGLYAVAIGQMVSALTMLLSRYWISKKFVEYKINWLPIIILIGIYTIISIISIFTTMFGNIFIFAIAVIITFILNKQFLAEIFGGLKPYVEKFKRKNN